MARSKLTELLQQSMSRRQFLSFTGVAALSMLGVLRVMSDLRTHAAGTARGFEPESGVVASPGMAVTDATASGGRAVEFGAGWGLPVGDIGPHWTQTVAEDFNRDCAEGAFKATYTTFDGFDNITDTSGIGHYKTTKTSVHNGMMDTFIGYDTATSTYTSAKIMPHKYTGQIYGKVTWRMHCDTIPQWKIVPLWWPKSGQWSDGEIDFPEGGIGNLAAFAVNVHNVTGTPAKNEFNHTFTGFSTKDDHVYDMEWTPTAMTFSIDGTVLSTCTYAAHPNAFPAAPMYWGMQMEVGDTTGNTIPDKTNSGHVYVDWVAMYTYNA